MSSVALYELAAEYRADLEKLADLELDEQTLADTLESMGGELQAKCTNVAMFAQSLDVMAEGMKAAEARMSTRRKATAARAERLRKYLKESMEACSISKIEHPAMRLRVQNNPEAVDVFDDKQLPAIYLNTAAAVSYDATGVDVTEEDRGGAPWLTISGPRDAFKVESTPDKAALKAAIKAGTEVPGAKLSRGTRLVIE
jgi:hypothetical protein